CTRARTRRRRTYSPSDTRGCMSRVWPRYCHCRRPAARERLQEPPCGSTRRTKVSCATGTTGRRVAGRTTQGPSRGSWRRGTNRAMRTRDHWGTIVLLAEVAGCLPKVDFAPCSERGNCPSHDVPDGEVDRPATCTDAACDERSVSDVVPELPLDA